MNKCNECDVYMNRKYTSETCETCDDSDSNFIPKDKDNYDLKCKLLIIRNKLSDAKKVIDAAEKEIDEFLNKKSINKF